MSATTDVILAAGPTVVALAAIGAAAWQQRRGFGHQREMADLSDTRSLFDEAAVTLHAASRSIHELELGLHNHGAAIRQHVPDAENGAERVGEAMKLLRARLGVRLQAGHPAVVAFGSAHDATWDALAAVWQLSWDAEMSVDLANQVVMDGHDRLLSATDDFMRAATETVGARLP